MNWTLYGGWHNATACWKNYQHENHLTNIYILRCFSWHSVHLVIWFWQLNIATNTSKCHNSALTFQKVPGKNPWTPRKNVAPSALVGPGTIAVSDRNPTITATAYTSFQPSYATERPVKRSFDVFVDLHQNKRLSKQSWGWWFETPLRLLWSHCNVPGTHYSQGWLYLGSPLEEHENMRIVALDCKLLEGNVSTIIFRYWCGFEYVAVNENLAACRIYAAAWFLKLTSTLSISTCLYL